MDWYDFVPGGRFVHDAFSVATGNGAPITQDTWGQRPTDARGITNYEYAHATANRDPSGNAIGVSTGLGLTRGRMPWSGEPGQPDVAAFDVLNANLDLGHHIDADGNRAYGINANANTLRTTGQV